MKAPKADWLHDINVLFANTIPTEGIVVAESDVPRKQTVVRAYDGIELSKFMDAHFKDGTPTTPADVDVGIGARKFDDDPSQERLSPIRRIRRCLISIYGLLAVFLGTLAYLLISYAPYLQKIFNYWEKLQHSDPVVALRSLPLHLYLCALLGFLVAFLHNKKHVYSANLWSSLQVRSSLALRVSPRLQVSLTQPRPGTHRTRPRRAHRSARSDRRRRAHPTLSLSESACRCAPASPTS